LHNTKRIVKRKLSNSSVNKSVFAMTIAEKIEAPKEAPKEVFRKDYKAYDYKIKHFNLDFDLGEEKTTVKAEMKMARAYEGDTRPITLNNGSDLTLKSISIDGAELGEDAYELSKKFLVIKNPPSADFTLATTVEIDPVNNTSLDGLYKSSGNFCTQCEAEGFRNITYYPDRPDVMTTFTTRITGDKAKYPVLLGNGNLSDCGDLEGGKHFAVWEDPFVKPCYLFALVAGDLANIEDTYKTMSGRTVILRIFTEEHNIHKCAHAMVSLKKSMKWDEDTYGLEYDLDLFNIVAVDDFNMGAMENKSLNVFNSKLVLASPTTATDSDYYQIEAVVGHEYFHNWTGNRVTCQDWFQLTLKEGLTVFRDQEFSSDLNNRGVKRVNDVIRLRAAQFAEDSSPMAHPVRPDSYIKMDNFYTVTVYEKGAEVVRLYQTLLGKAGFRKGMDLYFKRHDGQAVSCDEFLSAMEDANETKLDTFHRWYEQAGTPSVNVTCAYDPAAKTYTLDCTQTLPETPGGGAGKKPQLIPLAVGLLAADGKDMELTVAGKSQGTTAVLVLTELHQQFVFENVAVAPKTASVLRNFSAPVKLTTDQTTEELIFLLANDSDEFNRWEAGQRIAKELLLALYAKQLKGEELVMDERVVQAFKSVLTDASLDKSFIAVAMSIPSEGELTEMLDLADPDALHCVRNFVTKSIADGCNAELKQVVAENTEEKFSTEYDSVAKRALKNLALSYLAKLKTPEVVLELVKRFDGADNMTDQVAAMGALGGIDGPERALVLDKFYQQFQTDPLVMNKWLSIQAMSNIPGNTEKVKALLEHPTFDIKNPNKVYSLVGGFCSSYVNFHHKDGSGYDFLGDLIVKLDSLNPQVAARMVKPFTRWAKYDLGRQAVMKAQLSKILAAPTISENTYEICSKSLEQ